jgi:hypothetical protein
MGKIPNFKRPKRKDDEIAEAYYYGQIGDLERYQGRNLSRNSLARIQDREFGQSVSQINGKEISRIGRREFLRFAGLSGLVAGLAAVVEIPPARAPSSPSIGWTVDSGSMVIPVTYMIYVDPTGPTYLARNGLNGKNDFSNTDASTTLNQAFAQVITNGVAARTLVKAGDYPLDAVSPSVVFDAGSTGAFGGSYFTGESSGISDNGGLNGTRFLAGANNQTMLQMSTSRAITESYWNISRFAVFTNGFTGVVGLDTSQGAGQANVTAEIESVVFHNRAGVTNKGYFSYCMNLDGCDELFIRNCLDTGYAGSDCAQNASIHFNGLNGGAFYMTGGRWGSSRTLIGGWILAVFENVQMRTIQLINLPVYNGNNSMSFSGVWTGDTAPTGYPFIDCNGFSPLSIGIRDSAIGVNNHNFFQTGGQTITRIDMSRTDLMNLGGTVNLTDTPANLGTAYARASDCKVIRGVVGVSPWTLQSGFLSPPIAATVAVGASPVTITNSTPFRAIYTITGGTVSGITKGGVSVASSTGVSVFLDRGESMIITYSSLPSVSSIPLAD